MNNAILNKKKLSELLAITRAREEGSEQDRYYIDFSVDLDYDGKKDLVINESNKEFYDYVQKYTNKYIHDLEARKVLLSANEQFVDEVEIDVAEKGLLYMTYMNEKGLGLTDWERLIAVDDVEFYYILIQIFFRGLRKRPRFLDEVAKLYPDVFDNAGEEA